MRLAGILFALALAGTAHAAEINAGPIHPDDTTTLVVRLKGVIAAGDVDKFRAALAWAKATEKPIEGIYLNSPGGDVVAGILLANAIRSAGLQTIVPNNRMCASVCFLTFAAGTGRFARPHARIGVHGAAENGQETDLAAHATIVMARVAAGFGVPPAILGRMAVTPSSEMVWLTPDELRSISGTSAWDPTRGTAAAVR